MELNHLNLTVTSVEEAGTFLSKYFGLEFLGQENSMGFVSPENELVLTLTEGSEENVVYPSSFHVGFFTEDKECVERTHERLSMDGFDPTPLSDRGHSYGFYVDAPGGFTVEMGT